MGSKSNDKYFIRDRKKDTDTAEDHMKMEAETGAMQLQAKECPKPPVAGRGKEVFSPRAFGGSTTLLTP